MLGPPATNALRGNINTGQRLVRHSRSESDIECSTVTALDEEGSRVRLDLDVQAPPAGIGDADVGRVLRTVDGSCRNAHVVGKGRRERVGAVLERENGVVDRAPRVEAGGDRVAALESSVADQLRIESSVATVVDLLSSCEL